MYEEKIIKQILNRLNRLELAVFGDKEKSKKMVKRKKDVNFKGITGGIRFLISKSFFKGKKRAFDEIKKELNKYDYYSSRQSIQASLDQLSSTKGLLVKIKERGKNYYAERR